MIRLERTVGAGGRTQEAAGTIPLLSYNCAWTKGFSLEKDPLVVRLAAEVSDKWQEVTRVSIEASADMVYLLPAEHSFPKEHKEETSRRTKKAEKKKDEHVEGILPVMLHDQYMAPTHEDALKAYELFVETFEEKYPKAVECLRKDKEDLFVFYDFPSAHWIHIRTTNPIKSTFSTVRLRHRRTKGNGTRQATLTMVFKLCKEAEKSCRKLTGFHLVPLVEAGKKFMNGELVDGSAA